MFEHDLKTYSDLFGGIYKQLYHTGSNQALIEAAEESELLTKATKSVDILMKNRFFNTIDGTIIVDTESCNYIASNALTLLIDYHNQFYLEEELAGKGYLNLLKLVLSSRRQLYTDSRISSIFNKAIGNDRFGVCKYMIKEFPFLKESQHAVDNAFYTCCNFNRLKIAKWLRSMVYINISSYRYSGFLAACRSNNLDIVKWICDTFFKDIEVSSLEDTLFVMIHHSRAYDVAKYLANRYPGSFDDQKDRAFVSAVSFCDIDHAKWLLQHFPGILLPNNNDDTIFRNICRNTYIVETVTQALEFITEFYPEENIENIETIRECYKLAKQSKNRLINVFLLKKYAILRQDLQEEIDYNSGMLNEAING